MKCLCQEHEQCSCDDNDDPQYQSDILGNGSYQALDKKLVTVADQEGNSSNSTIYLNGSMGETGDTGGALSLGQNMMRAAGYWVLAAGVGAAVFMG